MSRTHIYLSKEAAAVVEFKDTELARLRAELSAAKAEQDALRKKLTALVAACESCDGIPVLICMPLCDAHSYLNQNPPAGREG